MNNTIKAELNTVFCDVFNNENLLIEEYMTSNDIDGWDSFNHLRLIMSVEKRFKIQISGFEIMKLRNVGDLIDLISKKATDAV